MARSRYVPHDRDARDFGDVLRLLRCSAIYRLVVSVWSTTETAAARSRIVSLARESVGVVAALGVDRRIRLLALFTLTAAAAEFGFSSMIPARSAPEIPAAIWLLVATGAMIPLFAPARVATAWDRWTRTRRARKLATRQSRA
jgi:hypothetical protein